MVMRIYLDRDRKATFTFEEAMKYLPGKENLTQEEIVSLFNQRYNKSYLIEIDPSGKSKLCYYAKSRRAWFPIAIVKKDNSLWKLSINITDRNGSNITYKTKKEALERACIFIAKYLYDIEERGLYSDARIKGLE